MRLHPAKNMTAHTGPYPLMIDVMIAVINPANLPLISKKPLITAASCGKVISLAKLSEIGIAEIWFMLLPKETAHIPALVPL